MNEDIESIGLTLRGAMDLTKDRENGGHLFVSNSAKWLASGNDDDNLSVT